MPSNLKTARVLMIDVSLILAISVIVVLLNLYLLDRIDDQLTAIDQVRSEKLVRVKQMKRIIRERSIVMVELASESDVWAFQELYLDFYRLASDFIVARDELIRLGLDEAEKGSLDSALATIRQTEVLQNNIVERLRSAIMADRSMADIHIEILKTDIPREFVLLGQMEALYEQIVDRSNLERSEAKQEFDRLLVAAAILSFVFLITIVLLMWRSIRRITAIETGLLEKTASLNWDATHDPLTRAHNRRWLEHRIETMEGTSIDKNVQHTLLYIDLDGFKEINDTYGHKAGDNFLIELCREAERSIRQNDTFCRMGGDEFAILLENCGRDFALKIADEVLQRAQRFRLEFEGNQLGVTCSIGVCQFTLDGIDFEDLVHHADELCYEAKRKGKNCIVSGDYQRDTG